MKTIAQQINWDFGANGSLEIKNKNGKRIYFENSSRYWSKREYDSEGNEIYVEKSDGTWLKREYNSRGNMIYFENSDGQIVDNRPKPSEDRVVEIDGVKYKLTKL
jgi:hypothetical protein